MDFFAEKAPPDKSAGSVPHEPVKLIRDGIAMGLAASPFTPNFA